MTVWHERKDFWEKTAPFIFTKRHWESAVQDLDYLVERLGVKAGDAILDLCCGPGRHSLEFARRGYKVTGVDIMPAYLDEARTRADEEDLEVEFIREDARHFERMEAFHGAILMYTSFGYFEDRWENLRVLENVLGSLKPGGKLVMDLMGKEVLARIFQEKGWEEQDGIFLLQERKVSMDWSWFENRWILLDGHDRFEYKVSHWIYSAAEISELLKVAGFQTVRHFGDLAGSPYGPSARRLVSVAQE